MPSLFSRSHSKRIRGQQSSPKTPVKTSDLPRTSGSTGGRGIQNGAIGEFGTTSSSSKSVVLWVYHRLLIKVQQRSLPARPARHLTAPHSPTTPPLLPSKCSFQSTSIHLPASLSQSTNSTHPADAPQPYGFLGYVRARVTLSLEAVSRLIRDVGGELERRGRYDRTHDTELIESSPGLATPMLFSNQAPEMSQIRMKMLIQAYLDTISYIMIYCVDEAELRSKNSQITPGSQNVSWQQQGFIHDLKLAKEHELAWLLRWALASLTRIREGSGEVLHGVMEWKVYEEWRGRERGS